MKLERLAVKLYKLFGAYVKAFEKESGPSSGKIWVRYNNGEIVVFANSPEKVAEAAIEIARRINER